jgi:hypothetical protein
MLFKQESQGLTNSNLLLIPPQKKLKKKEHDMRVRPAQQEKMKTRTKQPTKREQSPTVRPARKGETKGSPAVVVAKATPSEAPQEETVQVTPAAPSLLVPSPVFVRRDITLPDGTVRPGWEMWIGDHCFGRADSKELLLASFERLQSPPESFHWREVRNRMPMRGRPRPAQPQEEKEEPWGWGKKEEEPLLETEEAEGFQELSWDTPA